MPLLSLRHGPRVFIVLLVLGLLYKLHDWVSWSSESTKLTRRSLLEDARCSAYPDSGNIVFAIKTTASKANHEILSRLSATLHCLRSSNLLLFSDLEQRLGVYHLHDVLSRVEPLILQSHPDFELYRQQKFHAQDGHDVRDLRYGPLLRAGGPSNDDHSAQALDKHKILHMIERAWELQPGKDWYVFAEVDTFFSWPNIARWLEGMDPVKPRYLGTKSDLRDDDDLDIATAFGGIVLSGTAVQIFASAQIPLARKWDKKAADFTSGEHILAAALKTELKLTLTDSWPLTMGVDPTLIPFSNEIWCEPIISIPHVEANLSIQLQGLEKNLHTTSPSSAILAYRDLYTLFRRITPISPSSYWDNGASTSGPLTSLDPTISAADDPTLHPIAPLPSNPHHTLETCRQTCASLLSCNSYSYLHNGPPTKPQGRARRKSAGTTEEDDVADGGTCFLSRVLRVGKSTRLDVWDGDGADTQTWSSGWMFERFEAGRERVRC